MHGHLVKRMNCEREMESNRIVFLREDIFDRIFQENYLYALTHKNLDGTVSKSYYYYMVNFLKKVGLLKDDKVNFKLIVPFVLNEKKIVVRPAFMYCNNSVLYQVDYRVIYNKCSTCPYYDECIEFLKLLKDEYKLKSKAQNPREKIGELLDSFEEKILTKSEIIVIDDE